MAADLYIGLRTVLGLDADAVTVGQIALRALTIYVAGVVLVRVGDKRFLGKNAAFDVIFGIILGSVLSRVIAPPASFFGTLMAGGVLVGLHWLFAVLAFHWDWFGRLIKGDAHTVIQHGDIDWDAMRRNHITRKDLITALHINGKLSDPQEVEVARVERSGEISVIPAKRGFQVVDITVERGVQTVRVALL
jgi:uncharacterized membrane protein YcaP (DUF421 family)